MPKALEDKLKRQARKKGFSKERTGAYVYGTMRKMGWEPSHQKKRKVKRGKRAIPRGSAPFTNAEITQGFRRLG